MRSTPDQPTSDGDSIVAVNDLRIRKGYEQVLTANGLTSLDAMFQVRGDEVLNKPGLDSWRERVRLTLVENGEPRRFYLKRFLHPPAGSRREVCGAGLEAKSIAGAEWRASRALGECGVPAVEAVAFGEEHRGNREVRSAVLTAVVPGKSLESWVREWSAADRVMVRGLMRPLAKVVADMHGCGFVHRDLYLSHVYFDPENSEQPLQLIDLQRVLFHPRFMRRWIIKDLAALNMSTPKELVTRTDRWRWFRMYMGVSAGKRDVRTLAWRVVGKSMSMRRHEGRRQMRFRAADHATMIDQDVRPVAAVSRGLSP